MHTNRRRVLGATATVTAVVLAGCGGGSPDDDGTPDEEDGAADGDAGTPTEDDGQADDDTATDDDGAADGDQGSDGQVVQVSSHSELGEILVGPDEMTLYQFDSDTQGAGESTCYDGCAETWPPLTVDDEPTVGDDVTAEVTTFERQDGELQVAVDGWPMYYYTPDENPGDASGQGVGGVWWVVRPDGEVVRSEDEADAENETDAYLHARGSGRRHD